MYRILRKEKLTPVSYLMEVEAPLVARSAKAGQFIILIPHERGERIPLTIVDHDADRGSVTIIFQVVGKSTAYLADMNVGDTLYSFVGPLGRPIDVPEGKTVMCVGGGLGVAPIYPEVKAFKENGNHVITIIGARTKELLILEDEMRAVSDELIVCTDDGSYGEKGFVTGPMERILKERGDEIYEVDIIGPPIMMKIGAEITKKYGVKTIASLNALMVDGTGMCGACRVEVGGETKFTCVDGPSFDAHKVNFDELLSRLSTYRDKEQLAYEEYLKQKKAAQDTGRCE